MDCVNIQELLSAYIDNECNKEEKKIVEEHLETCEECLHEYRLLKALSEKLNEVEELPLPDGFHNELMANIKKEQESQVKPKKNIKSIYKWATPIAAVFIIVLGLVAIGSDNLRMFSSMNSDSMMEEATESYDEAMVEESVSVEDNSQAPREAQMDNQEKSTDSADYESGEASEMAPMEIADEEIVEEEAIIIESQETEEEAVTEEVAESEDMAMLDTEEVEEAQVENGDELTEEHEAAEETTTTTKASGTTSEEKVEITAGFTESTFEVNDNNTNHQGIETLFGIIGIIIIIGLLVIIIIRLKKLRK